VVGRLQFVEGDKACCCAATLKLPGGVRADCSRTVPAAGLPGNLLGDCIPSKLGLLD